jgi:hypothetical protein
VATPIPANTFKRIVEKQINRIFDETYDEYQYGVVERELWEKEVDFGQDIQDGKL